MEGTRRPGSSTFRRDRPDGGPLWSVVLAGGRGRRLRQTIRRLLGVSLPKQFCPLAGTRTLLQESVDRLRPRVPGSRTVVVVHAAHRSLAEAQLRRSGCRVLAQPADRGTGAAVLVALAHILALDPRAVVVLQPSDAGISGRETFLAGIDAAAAEVCRGAADVVLFGVGAAGPSTDYGWIVQGGVRGPLRRVEGFVEKPDALRAARLHAEGHLWNTMVLVARAQALVDLHLAAVPGAAAIARAGDARARRAAFLRLSPIDLSRDVLQRAPGLSAYAWPAHLGWSDLGTPERLLAWLRGRGEARLADRLEVAPEARAGVASGLRGHAR